jgi:hypothetical protein
LVHARTRWAVGVAAVAVAALVSADLTVLATGGPHSNPRAAVLVHRDLGALADPASIVEQADEARDAAISALLARRAEAILAHDQSAFLADVDPSDSAFVASQRALFTSLAAVPFSSLSFVLDSASAAGRPHPARYGTAGTLIPDVTMDYELADFDPTNATERQVDTFVHRGSRWFLASTSDLATLGAPSDQELWDYGQVAVVRGARSLVLGFAGDEPFLRALAAEADADIPQVSAVWGQDWPQRAVLEVPATQQQFAAVSGVSGDVSDVEAVQSTEVSGDGRAQQQTGNRITINPGAFHALSTAGQRVVLTHELTHVASRAATKSVTPLWLVEGLADYAGYLNSGLPESAITTELRDLVQKSGLPSALPANADFDNTDPDVAASYEEAWLACRLIATTYGAAQLVRIYTLVGASSASESAPAVDSALRTVTGETLATFTAQWHAYALAQLA